jgi:hypothetical protein
MSDEENDPRPIIGPTPTTVSAPKRGRPPKTPSESGPTDDVATQLRLLLRQNADILGRLQAIEHRAPSTTTAPATQDHPNGPPPPEDDNDDDNDDDDDDYRILERGIAYTQLQAEFAQLTSPAAAFVKEIALALFNRTLSTDSLVALLVPLAGYLHQGLSLEVITQALRDLLLEPPAHLSASHNNPKLRAEVFKVVKKAKKTAEWGRQYSTGARKPKNCAPARQPPRPAAFNGNLKCTHCNRTGHAVESCRTKAAGR